MTFDHCLQVGHDLAGMRAFGQRIDHRHGGMLGKGQQHVVRETADGDGIDITRQHARGVLDALTAADLHILCREHQRRTAKLADPDLEGNAGTRRRLLKDHRHRLSGKRPWPVLAGLQRRFHLSRMIEHGLQRVGAVIAYIQKMSHPTRPRRRPSGRVPARKSQLPARFPLH